MSYAVGCLGRAFSRSWVESDNVWSFFRYGTISDGSQSLTREEPFSKTRPEVCGDSRVYRMLQYNVDAESSPS